MEDPLSRAVDELAGLEVVDDLNGSADYKVHLAGQLLRRAARSALSEAIAHA
jgi:CO/xanthine dehydrogenase FAD-binding subunit